MRLEACFTGDLQKRITNSSFNEVSPMRNLNLPTINFKREFIRSVMDWEIGMLAKAAPSSEYRMHGGKGAK